MNFLVFALGRATGDVSFDPTAPVEDASATLHSAVLGYARSINFFGRSSSVAVAEPYIWGTLEGLVLGVPQEGRRSGLGDPVFRLAVNLYGAPAMDLEQFRRYRQTTVIGGSLTVSAPLGQYDSARLVNIGANRWEVKPELGISHRLGNWFLDLYVGAWFFAANDNFKGRVRTQEPLVSAQVHVSYNIRRRMWAALDANYYTGGRTSVSGLRDADFQRNSRIGGTFAMPLTKRQSVKLSVSTGARTNIGAAFTSLTAAYQYAWGGGM
jgi:hypothetical protein